MLSVAFRCAYCYHLNPARKKRDAAPKLMKTPSVTELTDKLAFALVQETSDAQDNTNTTEATKAAAFTKSASQDQLSIPEKGKHIVCEILVYNKQRCYLSSGGEQGGTANLIFELTDTIQEIQCNKCNRQSQYIFTYMSCMY